MKESIPDTKLLLRRLMRQRRANLSAHDQALAALALARRLAAVVAPTPGGLLLGTLTHRGEIDAFPFLQRWLEAGGRLALPRIDPGTNELEVRAVNQLDQTIMGFRGLSEPDPDRTVVISARHLPAILIPGCAFDPRGNRLGQGGGHYDRFLSRVDQSAIRIGIAHDFQILPGIPTIEGVDQPMDFVVSPVRVIHCRRRRDRLAPG